MSLPFDSDTLPTSIQHGCQRSVGFICFFVIRLYTRCMNSVLSYPCNGNNDDTLNEPYELINAQYTIYCTVFIVQVRNAFQYIVCYGWYTVVAEHCFTVCEKKNI